MIERDRVVDTPARGARRMSTVSGVGLAIRAGWLIARVRIAPVAAATSCE
jgi:hypothetical protein